LNRNQEQLKGLVTNLRIVTGSFAAEDQALASAIHELPGVLDAARPALDNLNAAFPPLRAFAREALPGVRSSGPTLEAALPFIRQLRALVSRSELRGLTADLRPTIPQLAKLTKRQIPFMEQARALSSCFTHTVIPWSNDKVGDGSTDASGDPISEVYKETGYGLVGIAGESRSGDANGQYIRVALGGGNNTVVQPAGTVQGVNEDLVGLSMNPLLGSEPGFESKPPIKPSVPCENQEAPNLDTQLGPAPARQYPNPGAGKPALQTSVMQTPLGPALRQYKSLYENYLAARKDVLARRKGSAAELIGVYKQLQQLDTKTWPKAAQAFKQSIGGAG
jgi:hypothetical protein